MRFRSRRARETARRCGGLPRGANSDLPRRQASAPADVRGGTRHPPSLRTNSDGGRAENVSLFVSLFSGIFVCLFVFFFNLLPINFFVFSSARSVAGGAENRLAARDSAKSSRPARTGRLFRARITGLEAHPRVISHRVTRRVAPPSGHYAPGERFPAFCKVVYPSSPSIAKAAPAAKRPSRLHVHSALLAYDTITVSTGVALIVLSFRGYTRFGSAEFDVSSSS